MKKILIIHLCTILYLFSSDISIVIEPSNKKEKVIIDQRPIQRFQEERNVRLQREKIMRKLSIFSFWKDLYRHASSSLFERHIARARESKKITQKTI